MILKESNNSIALVPTPITTLTGLNNLIPLGVK